MAIMGRMHGSTVFSLVRLWCSYRSGVGYITYSLLSESWTCTLGANFTFTLGVSVTLSSSLLDRVWSLSSGRVFTGFGELGVSLVYYRSCRPTDHSLQVLSMQSREVLSGASLASAFPQDASGLLEAWCPASYFIVEVLPYSHTCFGDSAAWRENHELAPLSVYSFTPFVFITPLKG